MPILTNSGRVVIAESIALRPLHLAWGTADGAWTSPPTESAGATSLLAEIGRRASSEVTYVTPDTGGDVILPTGTYSRSSIPTNHLLAVFNFDFGDSSSSEIREIGIFAGSVAVSGLPSGQKYFSPAQIATTGRLLHLENITPIFRSPAVRENFEIVITF